MAKSVTRGREVGKSRSREVDNGGDRSRIAADIVDIEEQVEVFRNRASQFGESGQRLREPLRRLQRLR